MTRDASGEIVLVPVDRAGLVDGITRCLPKDSCPFYWLRVEDATSVALEPQVRP